MPPTDGTWSPLLVDAGSELFNANKDPNKALLIISYETASIHCDTLMKAPYELIVCDEAHKLKNPKTKACALSFAPPASRDARCFARQTLETKASHALVPLRGTALRQLYKNLHPLRSTMRIMVTGTPIQVLRRVVGCCSDGSGRPWHGVLWGASQLQVVGGPPCALYRGERGT